MKTTLFLLLLAGSGYAQTPTKSVRQDSLPGRFSPDQMPTLRSDNSFYRYQSDPANVMRASLDNMPVKVADSSVRYTMLHSYQQQIRPRESPMPFLNPIPPVLPKNWKKK